MPNTPGDKLPYDGATIPADQVEAFQRRVIENFRNLSTEQFTNYNYNVWRCMTQDEREVVAVLIKQDKTSQEIADTLEHFWFGEKRDG